MVLLAAPGQPHGHALRSQRYRQRARATSRAGGLCRALRNFFDHRTPGGERAPRRDRPRPPSRARAAGRRPMAGSAATRFRSRSCAMAGMRRSCAWSCFPLV